MIVKKRNNIIAIDHAPLGKFNIHADRYIISIDPKNNKKQADRNKLFSQYKAIISDIRQVVTSIPRMIAKPVNKRTKEANL